MKQYPSIPTEKPNVRATEYWAFDKLDGSNIRAEWSRKKGFYKFGSRKRLLGTDQGEILNYSVDLIRAHEDTIARQLTEARFQHAVCFFEFVGEKSFAGLHNEDDIFETFLIDIATDKKGILPPKEFVNLIAECDIPAPTLLYKGPITNDIIQSVRDGSLNGMTFEGVVFKAKPDRKNQQPAMFKVKNQAWLDKVKATFAKEQWEELL